MAQNSIRTELLDTFGGLPIHPLAVHFAVVLLPVSALALAVLIFMPRWRQTFLPITLGALLVATGFAFIAKESGEELAERIGEPQTHAALGSILFPAAVGLLALGLAFFFLQRTQRPKWQIQGAAALALAGIISVSTLTYFVGHTGAEATWASRIATVETIAPSETSSPAATNVEAGITKDEFAKHASKDDCWVIIDAQVYNLTSYIQSHPGGPAVLQRLCGSDATAAFKNQHGSQQLPASELATLLVGAYSGNVSAPAQTTDPTADPSPSASAPNSQPGQYTAAEVAKHNTGSDCWSVVNGKVYDLTSYVSNHPGGPNVIKAICGKDGTAAFTGQHAGASRPNNTLNGFLLGPLATSAAGTTTLQPAPAPAGGEDDEEDEEGEEGEDH